MNPATPFISDGPELARAALEPAVRSEVEQEFRAQLAEASWFGRLRLRWLIRREIEARIERLAPDNGLY